MCIALLGCVLCGSIVYDPHKSSSLRDPATQTAVGGIQSAGPPFIISSAITSLRVTTAWAQHLVAYCCFLRPTSGSEFFDTFLRILPL